MYRLPIVACTCWTDRCVDMSYPGAVSDTLFHICPCAVEDELAALKRGAGARKPAQAALPEERPYRDAIDMELEALRQKARE